MEGLIEATEKLLTKIKLLAEDCISKNLIQPEMATYRRRKISQFEEKQTGGELRGWQMEYFNKAEWFRGAEFVFKHVHSFSEFQTFSSEMAKTFPENKNIEDTLGKIVRHLVGGLLHGESYVAREVCSLIQRELTNQPLAATCEIEVQGFDLFVKRLELEMGERQHLFRQLVQADFEKETSLFEIENPMPGALNTPSSILQISMPARVPLDFQREGERALISLRLFRVCSVSFGQQSFKAKTLVGYFGGVSSPGAIKRGQDKLQIKEPDVAKFLRFYSTIIDLIPASLNAYAEKEEETFLKIAYERYCDSQFHGGKSDGRIGFAVMALEALFLGRDEKVDLKFRLGMRVAKMLSKFGMNGPGVNQRVQEAYNIRSTYVHGSHLSSKGRDKVEKKLSITLDDLRHSILDYVRIAIVVFLVEKTDKEKLLELLDASLLDVASDSQIDELLQNSRGLLV
jgi:hypothetical protein